MEVCRNFTFTATVYSRGYYSKPSKIQNIKWAGQLQMIDSKLFVADLINFESQFLLALYTIFCVTVSSYDLEQFKLITGNGVSSLFTFSNYLRYYLY